MSLKAISTSGGGGSGGPFLPLAGGAMSGNIVFGGSSAIDDSTSNISISPTTRQLYYSSGINSIDYQNGDLFDASGQFSFSYAARQLYQSSFTGNSVTVDYQNGDLYDIEAVPSVFWFDRELFDSSDGISAAWDARFLYDSSKNQSLDWDLGFLLSPSGVEAVAWQSGLLTTPTGGVLSQDWQNRILYDSSAVTSLDYALRHLLDGSNVESASWDARLLINSSGLKTLDWQNTYLLDSALNFAAVWGTRHLCDAFSTNSMDWGSRYLLTANGTTIALNWNSNIQAVWAVQSKFAASTTSAASINIPSGTAPTSPVDGDIWYDGVYFKGRTAASTITLSAPGILSTTSINAKSIANTSLYTVPTGRTAIVTGAIVRCTASSAITVGPSAGIGNTAGTSNILASIAMTNLINTTTTTSTNLYAFSNIGMSAYTAAAGQIYFNLGTAATGTSQTVSVDLIGYLV